MALAVTGYKKTIMHLAYGILFFNIYCAAALEQHQPENINTAPTFPFITVYALPGLCGSIKIIPKPGYVDTPLYLRITTSAQSPRSIASWQDEIIANIGRNWPRHAHEHNSMQALQPVALSVEEQAKEPEIKGVIITNNQLHAYIARHIGNYYRDPQTYLLPAQGIRFRYDGGTLYKIYVFLSPNFDQDPVDPNIYLTTENIINNVPCFGLSGSTDSYEPFNLKN